MALVGAPIEQRRLIRFCAYYFIASTKVRGQGKAGRLSSREIGERLDLSRTTVRMDMCTMPGWTGRPGHAYFAYEVAERAMLYLETYVGSDDSAAVAIILTWKDERMARIARNGLLLYNRDRLMVR